MAKACSYAPKKGTKTFYKLKKEFGYDTAWKIYGIAMNPKFQNDFKNSLRLDSEGVPSYDSLINNSAILKYAGKQVRKALAKNFPIREDTIDNYSLALDDALKFNKENTLNDKLTAVVEYSNDKITVNLLPKDESSDKKFAEQYALHKLNMKIFDILKPLGVTIGMITDEEVKAGRVGITDFSIAKRLAHDTVSMIRVANNMEGVQALSEEFAHIIVRAMINTPLMQRNLSIMSNEEALRAILKDDYEDVSKFHNGNISLMAEEALGHILQNRMIEYMTESKTSLLDRLIRYIQNKFKRISEKEVNSAISDVESIMSNIAKNVLNSSNNLSKKDLIYSQTDLKLNALSNRTKRNIELLKKAISTEAKRAKISNSESSKKYGDTMVKYINRTLRNTDTTLGVLSYANEALKSLKSSNKYMSTLYSLSLRDRFKALLSVRSTIQSYGEFISDLNDLAIAEEKEDTNDFLRDIVVDDIKGNKSVINTKDIIKELNNEYENITRRYLKEAIPAFAEYLKPILGSEITLEMGDKAGSKVSIEELLRMSESDISFMDRWLDSMGNSSDILLRAFDKVYKEAMDKARLKSISDIKRIQALRLEAESLGIRDFDWMFERDSKGNLTGNYIQEINETQFIRDIDELENRLNDKYGKNPKEDALAAKLAERKEWYSKHSVLLVTGERVADPDIYRNKDFDLLTDNQKMIRDKFLSIKKEMDEQYPANRVSELKAIQMRKDGLQRFLDSANSPSSILDNIKGHLAEEFLDRPDDDNIFGVSSRGLVDFSGKEFMVLPVLFTNRLENPNELTTDIFGSLIAYTSASNNYSALDSIIDPLEVGRSIVTDVRKTKSTRGGQNVSEVFGNYGEKFQNFIFEGKGSNIEKRLDDFFASQVYHKYLKDSGTLNILGTKANKNKLTSWILKGSSLAQLGFNGLTGLANVLTGVCMQNIEAASCEFFNPKELFNADEIYLKYIIPSLSEAASRNKKTKLSLFNELFNVRQDFETTTRNNMKKGILARIFNSDIAYLVQSGGDHWLYSRTAIAMALREKVTVPNKGEMSLWDALQIESAFGNDNIKEMKLPEGTLDSNGNPFNIGAFSRKVAHINQNLFGIYNTDDRNAAQRIIAGRLLLQYRNWMKPQYNRRFQRAQKNLDTDTIEEGYYRTLGRVLMGLKRGEYQLGSVMSELSTTEKANVIRAITELAQLIAISALVHLVEWPDGKNRPWHIKLAEYSARRLEHELGALAPSPILLQETLKTIKSPAASISYVQNLLNLGISALTPTDYFTVMKQGPYKDMTIFEKNLYKSGLPIIGQYKQYQRMVYDIDNSINYYARPQ